jgi:hypothetical protein
MTIVSETRRRMRSPSSAARAADLSEEARTRRAALGAT